MLHAEWIQDVGGNFRLKSEQGLPDLKALKLENTTSVDLSSAGVIARDTEGNYFAGWIGNFAAGDGTVEASLDATEKFDIPQLWAGEAGLTSMLASPQQLMSRLTIEDGDRISLRQIKEWTLLEPYWQSFEDLSELNPKTGQPSITRSQFLSFIGQAKLNETESLVGNLLTVVLDNLELGKGEIRLLGISDQQIGGTRFDPESTQTTTQTLVVAHLRQPDLPPAQRDLNSVLDFTQARSPLTDQYNNITDETFDATLEEE